MDSYAHTLLYNIGKAYELPPPNSANYKRLYNDLRQLMNKNPTADNFRQFLSKLKPLPKKTDQARANERVSGVVDILGDQLTPKSILDIGAGTGDITIALKNYYKLDPTAVFAIDEKLPQTQQISPLTYVEGKIPLPTNSVDLIIMFAVLHHINPQRRKEILSEAARVLSPEGAIIIREHDYNNDPNFYTFLDLLHMLWYIAYNETQDPLYLMSRRETQDLFEQIGFTSKNYITYGKSNLQKLYHEMFVRTIIPSQPTKDTSPLITNNFYYIPTSKYIPENIETLLEKDQEVIYNQAADELIPLVKDGTIWFPYHKYFMTDPEVLFENLKKIEPQIKYNQYKLYSYYPKYDNYLPPLFRDKYITIVGNHNDYESADVITDFFTEDVRLKAKRYDQQYSMVECWNTDLCLKSILINALKKDNISPPTLRDAIYETIAETTTFKPTMARALLKVVIGNDLRNKKWLDISAGWGDRLIAAISLNMQYTGFDPNTELKSGHTQIIKMFGDTSRQKIIYEPFEKAKILNGPYDVIFTSPPFFNVEIYAENQPGQSITNYPDFTTWLVWFLFASLDKAWDNLNENGYLILHLGDIKTLSICEVTNIFIDNYLRQSSWEGVIGISGESETFRLTWVYKKTTIRKLWEPKDRTGIPSNKRTLYYTYPDIQQEILKFYCAKYAINYSNKLADIKLVREMVEGNFDDLLISSLLEVMDIDQTIVTLSTNVNTEIAPYYAVRKANANILRNEIGRQLPQVEQKVINDLFKNDLVLVSLLETLQVEGTIKWCIAMAMLALHI